MSLLRLVQRGVLALPVVLAVAVAIGVPELLCCCSKTDPDYRLFRIILLALLHGQ